MKQQLAADEIDTLMGVIAQTSETERTQFIDAIKALPVEAAAELCRDLVKTIREQTTHAAPPTESR